MTNCKLLPKAYPQEKLLRVWSSDIPADILRQYKQQGYTIAYMFPGSNKANNTISQILSTRR